MQNIDVRFNATGNFGNVKSELAALQTQAAALAKTLQSNAYAASPAALDPIKWRASTTAVEQASKIYRDAASSSGLLTMQQVRATSETEKMTRALQKQKVSLGEMLKNRGLMMQVYRDQLRGQRMTVQNWGTDSSGKTIMDISVPKNVPADLDNIKNRLGFISAAAKSASTDIINMGKNVQWSGRQLTVGFSYPLAMIGAAAGVMSYKVEDAFASINKVYDVSAEAMENEALRTKELNALRVNSMETATKAAQDYGKGIESTLKVQQELAATGLNGGILQAATKETQRISALGDIDPAQTTDMVVSLQNAFRGTIGKDAQKLTDTLNFMNGVANATSLSLQDIAEATPRAASAMAALGGTAEDMTVLLVSMREAGVNAAEGANALKSATARILNPTILNKATKIFKGFGADIDVAALSDQSGGNMLKFIELLGTAMNATDELNQKQKQTAVATLFGTYQFNRMTAALTNVSDAYGGVENQAYKAMQIQKMSSEELANMAENSRKLMVDNPAGRLKVAWAEVQIQLEQVGQPFLAIASRFLEFVSKVLSGFNEMNDTFKNIFMGGAFGVALAGPLVMLVGLFLQLSGWLTKAGAGFVGLFGKMRILTTEQRAQAAALESQNSAAMKATNVANTQRQEMAALSEAYRQASARVKEYTTAVLQQEQATTGVRPFTETKLGVGHRYIGGTVGPEPYVNPRSKGRFRSNADVEKEISDNRRLARERAADMAAYDRATGNAYQNRVRMHNEIRAQQKREVAAYEKTVSVAQGISPALLGGVSALTMMTTENDSFINSLSKWLLIGTLVVPAVKAASVWVGRMAVSAGVFAKNMMAGAGAANATAAAGMKGIGQGLLTGLGGKAGVAGLAITATVGVATWAHKKGKEMQAERLRLAKEEGAVQNQLADSTDRWLSTLEKAPAAWRKVYTASKQVVEQDKTEMQELVSYYSTPQGEAKMSDADALTKDSVSTDERNVMLMQKYVELQVRGGLTAKEAKRHIEALGLAMNMGSVEASLLGESMGSLGEIGKNFDWSGLLEQNLDALDGATKYEMNAFGANAAQAFSSGLARAGKSGNKDAAKELLSQYVDPIGNQIGSVYDRIVEKAKQSGPGGTENPLTKWLIDNAIESEKDLAAYIQKNGIGDIPNIISQGRGPKSKSDLKLNDDLNKAKAMQDALIKGMDAIYNYDKGQVNSIFDIPNLGEIAAVTQTYDEQKKIVQDMEKSWRFNALGIETSGSHLSKQEKQLRLNAINAINVANGFKEGATEAEAIGYFMMRTKAEIDKAAGSAKGLKLGLDGLPSRIDVEISYSQGKEIAKTAMAATQDRMVASANEKFEAGWTARMDGMKESHQAATDAMEAANDRAQKAFDERWERRKRALEEEFDKRKEKIDKQIEAEQRAEEIRKRLFDAERRRMEQLAERQNRDIDMSQAIAEGRTDDAARIAVNGQTTDSNNNMDNEEAAASSRADDRIARLEQKSDALDKKRDAALEKLEKTEERMRAHMERAQQARSAALTKQQNAQIASLDKQKAYEKASLDQRLTLFKSYTGKNQKDLEAWMKTVGLTYDDFGSDVMAKGDSWSKHFKTALRTEILLAGTQVASNNMWEEIGDDMVAKLIKGMGFKDWNSFKKFVETGKLNKTPNSAVGGGKRAGADAPEGTSHNATMHGGGVVGRGSSGRGNIPNSYKGLHPTEEIVRAQKGEYIVRRDAAQDPNNRAVLDAINSGQELPAFGGGGVGSVPAAAMGTMVKAGITKAFQRGVTKANKQGKALQRSNENPETIVGGGGFKKPTGKWNSPWSGHYSTRNGHDYPLVYKPLYAPANGTITSHATYTGSKGPKNGGFGSYGQHVKFYGQGASMMFAHLSKLPIAAGGSMKVKAGQYIGTSGETGNAWGPHVHVELPTNTGNSWNFGSFFRQAGVSLRTGGTIKYDETPAMLHKGETVLTSALTKRFSENVASGGGDSYTVTIDLRGAYIKEDVDIERAVNTALDKRETKRGRKRTVR